MQLRKIFNLLQPMEITLRWLWLDQEIHDGDHQSVREFLDKMTDSIASSPTPEIHNHVGISYLNIGEIEKARQCFERALATDNENSDAFRGLAEVAANEEDWEATVAHALTATELQFSNPWSHYLLARGFDELGDLDHARVAYEAAINLAPGLLTAREHYLAFLKRTGDQQEATA